MPKYKEYSMKEYEKMLSDDFSNNYGISEEKIAKHFMEAKGAQAVISYYGDITYQRMLDVYIPMLKKGLNGGYVFFLLYTISEGGGAGNWINHYEQNSTGNSEGDMQADIDYLNSVTKSLPIADNAPEVLNYTRYIEDNNGADDKFYKSIPDNSIGALWMPSTMAGNSWVWATKWTLANQGPEPLCYFGNPYDLYINSVKSLGGSLTGNDKPPKPPKPGDNGGGGGSAGGGGGSAGGGGGGNSGNPDTGGDTGEGVDSDKNDENTQNIIKGMIDNVKKLMNFELFSTNLNQTKHANKNFVADKSYNNTIRISTTKTFNKNINDDISGIEPPSNNYNIPDDDSGSNPNNSVEPNGKNGDIVGGVFLWENLPDIYKDVIKIDLPNKITGNDNWFCKHGAKGTQNEFVYYYLTQLENNEQPKSDETGENPKPQDLYKIYYNSPNKCRITHKPTIGYGFSSKYNFGNATMKMVGNSGVVIGVFSDGGFLCASFNQKPYLATSRDICYFKLDGVDKDAKDNLLFFSPILKKTPQKDELIFPMEYLNISQGRDGGYSHQNVNAYDLIGKGTGIDPMFAPTKMKCIKTYVDSYGGNTSMFQSVEKVTFADGRNDKLLIMCIHSNDANIVNAVYEKGEIIFTEGTSGNVTGNHIHSEWGYGNPLGDPMYKVNGAGVWEANFNHINIEDVFYIDDNIKVINDGGYKFKKSN